MKSGFINPIILIGIGLLLVGGGVGFVASKGFSAAKTNQHSSVTETMLITDSSESITDASTTTRQTSKDSVEPLVSTAALSTTLVCGAAVDTKDSVEPLVSTAAPHTSVVESAAISTTTNTRAEFSISDVSVVPSHSQVIISWETSQPSESRVMLYKGEKKAVYPSVNHNSVSHQVKIVNLDLSTNYAFEIIAAGSGQEDTYYDSFWTEREFVAEYAVSEEDDDCTIVTVEDTSGNPLQNILIEMEGIYNLNGHRVVYSNYIQTDTTNDEGEATYCGKFTSMKITDVNTNDIYVE